MATYVTKDDYLKFAGIDLDLELKKTNYDNPTGAVDIFITRIEDWCKDYLYSKYFTNDDNFEATYFKKGVLHQIEYTLKNGEGDILAPKAFQQFQLGGMCNTSQPNYTGIWY